MAMMISVLVIIQLSFSFAAYSLNEAIRSSESSEHVEIVGNAGVTYMSSDAGNITGENIRLYDFHYFEDYSIVFHINQNYYSGQIFNIWLNLLTTLVISVFFP